jgi:hypothetical protein
VYDVAWSPIHPALFAAVDGTGRLDLWNLNKDTEVRKIAVLRIRDVYPGSDFFSIPDPIFFHPGYASENLSILTQKIVSNLSET